MSLEAKIRAILDESDGGMAERKKISDKANAEGNEGSDNDGAEDENQKGNNKKADKDAIGKKGDNQPVGFGKGSSNETDLAKDSKSKDKAEVKEEVTTVPGIGKSLTAVPVLSNVAKEETAKILAKYNRGTKNKEVEDEPVGFKGSDAQDDKASQENAKIKQNYSDTSGMKKLRAEAFEALFSGEQLTEDFKTKAEAIFEAAVEQISEEKIQALQEEYQEQLVEAVEEVKGELVEQIDGYLDLVVEKWLKDNAVALESGIKVEMVSSFMEGMKNVFTEHYISVPESKVDVVAEQAAKIEEMEADLAHLAEATQRAQSEVSILKCEAIIAEHQVGLTAIEAEKLYSLAENVDFDTEEEFASKIASLKESYFRKSKTGVNITTQATHVALDESTNNGEMSSDVAAVMNVLKSKDGIKLIRSSN